VTKAGMNAVQTQSYGSEARGGECQAEVVVSRQAIGSPLSDQMDILVSMSQTAVNKYLPRLKSKGFLILDPEFVNKPDRSDITVIEVPATRIAGEIGVKLAANMVMLGFLQQGMGIFNQRSLLEVVRENVPERFVDANLEAVKQGSNLAKNKGVILEV